MSTSLYVSNERLAAVCGVASRARASIQAYASAALPAGAVLNGVVTDEKLFTDALTNLRGQLGNRLNSVRLVVSSSQIYVKRAAVPKVSTRKLADLVKNEFSDVEAGDDELLCDYRILSENGKDGGQTALLCAAKRGLIATYDELYRANRIRLTGVDVAVDALAKLVTLLPSLRNGTFILLDLDGNTLEAALFVLGEFRFHNRTRLMNERGTLESIAEITRIVSSMIQFNTSERSGQSVSAVHLIGTRDTELALMNSLQTAFDLPCVPLSDDSGTIRAAGCEPPELAAYAAAIGNLIE